MVLDDFSVIGAWSLAVPNESTATPSLTGGLVKFVNGVVERRPRCTGCPGVSDELDVFRRSQMNNLLSLPPEANTKSSKGLNFKPQTSFLN